MEPPKVIGYILIAAVLCTLGYTAKQAVVSRKSKLCGNAECGEILFKARVKRVMGVNSDPSFLNLVENAVISVVAVKFSDRPDIMEGKLNDEGPSGFFYVGAIDILPFAEFLRAAIDEKKEMLMISQNPADTGDKRIVGYVHSETDLVRDYNAKNAQAAAENGLPPPEALPIPEPPASGHGHSHGGHGHSHGGHGHSHGHPAPTPEPAKAPEMTPEVVKSAENAPKSTENAPESAENAPKLTENAPETIKNAPDVAPDAVKSPSPPPPNLNNVLGGKPETKIGLSDMDLEIERMIREEEERMAAGKQEEKQEDLVLKSLPESLKFEQIQPEVVENAPETVVTAPESVTTTTVTPEDVPPPPFTQDTPTTAPIVPIVEEPVPTTTPPPLVLPEEPVLTEGLPEEPVTQTAPVEPPVVAQEDLTTPPPPQIVVAAETAPEVTTTTPTPESPESAHLHHGHSHDGAEGHGHSHDAPEDVRVPEVVPEDVKAPEDVPEDVKRSPEEEEFLKWENERSKREAAPAAPYEDAQSHQFQHKLPPNPPASAGIFDWIRSVLSLGNVTDGTVLLYINLTFFIASLVFYVIVRSLSTGGDSDVLDRQAYFDLVTKHKQLQIQLQQKVDENQRLQQNGVPQQQQMPDREPELMALRQQVQSLQNEIQMAAAHRQDYESHYNQMRDALEQKEQQIGQLTEVINDYKERLERSSTESQEFARQLDSVRSELTETQQSSFGRHQEFVEKQQETERLQTRIQELGGETRQMTSRIQHLEQIQTTLEVEVKDLKSENTGLLGTIQQLEAEILEASKNNDEAGESGGSGWSDFGDTDEVEVKEEEKLTEKTPENTEELRAKYKKYGEDMEELSKAKVRLSELEKKLDETEKELSKYRNLYDRQKDQESRGVTETDIKLKTAETECAELKKQIERLNKLKEEADERFSSLSNSYGAVLTKSGETNIQFQSLRDEKNALETKLKDMEAVIAKKEEKIRDAESEAKRVQAAYKKLETKSFHDVMTLKKECDELKSAQYLSGGGGGRDNMFSTNRSISRTDRIASPLVDEPIWDEPVEYQTQNQMTSLPPQEMDYYSSGSGVTMPSRRRSTRRSHLIGGESPSDLEKKKKDPTSSGVTQHRRRSRSQGRQQYPTYPDPYQYGIHPGSSDSSFLSNLGGFQPLTKRHSKSGHLSGGGGGGHYSSGGSNGGRSPPPEMPLLSAIPPPGARKPMSKRPDSAHHHGK
ncbi:hypothetical protein GCK72_011293 [Caenorhabditis remanei]|uniref:Uncharacterized protein n=1 Tax=Caenorhabditis remanei TaxID=31234 RepID=A0A6A5H5M0_CAERE|nr:hypothetical protein GCK72_011293 [Caenorhabditis remanei]KAF1763028.1 hypothetical protein GCK72_011293 [Caenorhabditis remanei]